MKEKPPAKRQLGAKQWTPPPHHVTTSAQLRNHGLSASTIASKCRPGGPWRRLLPGVILLSSEEPTREQKLHAALAQVGTDAVITGVDALRTYGLPLPVTPTIRLLVPAQRRILSREFVELERTTRIPQPLIQQGLPFCPPVRAVLDMARREHDLNQLHTLLRLSVYHGLCTIGQLKEELDAGNQRGSAAVREALQHLGPTMNTMAYATARALLLRTSLPAPRWNISVTDRKNYPLGRVDAWWEEVAMGWQFTIDQTQEEVRPSVKHLALTAAGVMLVRTHREKLKKESPLIVRELTNAFTAAARRKPPQVRTLSLLGTS